MWSLIWALVGCVVMFILGRVNSPMFISIAAIKNYYDTPLTPPTPSKVYMIVEATTGKAVTVAYGVPYLQHIKDNNEYTH
ncbi:hypothetical protein THARTR1_07523 [Trichoderma harzianum]|uniref:Uncharacterized protein n=1 Tax=Trichoderma harzianum TaxID=5544 RepID=A0A2K0U1U7_TRIHA|nr:hypothetical protein THARTR1_07523 [Trichoderma harzianum]